MEPPALSEEAAEWEYVGAPTAGDHPVRSYPERRARPCARSRPNSRPTRIPENGISVNQQVEQVYLALDDAIQRDVLITREGSRDKEFHFQEWFQARLSEASIEHVVNGRNSYPDVTLTDSPEGFEIKGLAHPGRVATFDANSNIPTGLHDGRTIYYVFGRYPKEADSNEYPVIDLVLCHGDLLNADREYVHQNKSVKGFGSYGDIMIRDRKMYVVPTPFALLDGTPFRRTLILPDNMSVKNDRLTPVSRFLRRQSEYSLLAYEFDLRSNNLEARLSANPTSDTEHWFTAYRSPESYKSVSGDPL